MPNSNIPADERTLTPAQVETLDKRRQRGLLCQVLSGQFAFFAVLLLLWSGQDLTYGPGWVHPMFYYDVLTAVLAISFGIYGTWLRRGRIHEY